MGRMTISRLPGEGFTLTAPTGEVVTVVIESVRRGPSGRMEISITAPEEIRIGRIGPPEND